MNFVRGVFVLLMTTLSAQAASAAQPALPGTSSFAIDCANPTFLLRFTADAAPLAVRTQNISSKVDSENPVKWLVGWQKPQPSDPTIKEYQTTGTVTGPCPNPGTYTIPLLVLFPDPAPPVRLEIELRRAAEPVLDAPTSITLRSDWPVFGGLPQVGSIQLRETSHAAAIDSISATGGPLKNAAGESTEVALKPDSKPLTLKPGHAEELKLDLSNTPPPGAYTTRLILHSPALKQNQNIDVTLKVRVYSIFLLLMIAAGVVVGWWINIRLAGRATLDAARIEGLRSAAAIGRRTTAQKDPAVQQRLIALVAELESSIRRAKTLPEVQKAATDSATRADAIESEATKSADMLRQALARVRGILEPNHVAPDSLVAERLAALAEKLGAIDDAAASGDVVEAQRRLNELEQQLLPAITEALRPWLEELNRKLADLGPWAAPAQALDQGRTVLLAEIKTAYQAQPADLVQQCGKIAGALRVLVVFTGPQAVAEALRAAAAILRHGGPADLAQKLASLADDLLRRSAANVGPLDILAMLAATRREAEKQMQLAKPGDAALIQRLGSGDFLGAATVLAPQAAPAPAPVAQPALIARTPAPLVAPAPVVLRPRLLIPALLPLNKPSTAELRWDTAAPAAKVVAWSCTPNEAASIANSSATGAAITPLLPGFFTVSVAIPGGQIDASAYAGEVTQTLDFTQLEKDSRLINNVIWTVTAVLTALTGYFIFASTWFGTVADFFSAFVWGFFGQFGLDRVREVVRPVISRTLP